jgi:hypothetical protein
MAAHLGVILGGGRSARDLGVHSRAALDRPLRYPAELWVAVARDEALLLGAFQRVTDTRFGSGTLLLRGSGGPEVFVGEGTVHVLLALAYPGALVACDEKRIVNRYVRPLLRALNKTVGAGIPAHFFGRDWVSVAHRPAAWVGFAHDATTRRTVFEAFVAVRSPFAVTQRPSFRDRLAGSLESIAQRQLDPSHIAQAIVDAYAGLAETILLDAPDAQPDAVDLRADPPWAATCEEAIGIVAAGPDARGILRVGGELLVSRDALARLEERAALVGDDDLSRIVDESLAAPGVALDGVRSLASVRDVIARARRTTGP